MKAEKYYAAREDPSRYHLGGGVPHTKRPRTAGKKLGGWGVANCQSEAD